MAKLSYVQKQKQFLVKKGQEMVYWNLNNLDKLEAIERQESEAIASASGAFDRVEVDWGAMDFSSLGPADLGALSETLGQVAGNVSSS